MPSQQGLTIITVHKGLPIGFGRTLQSLGEQTHKCFAHIAVVADDDYFDESSRLHNEFLELNALRGFVIRDLAIGIYQAMNLGLAAVETSHLWYVNSGDRLCQSSTLETLAPHLETLRPDESLFGQVITPSGRTVGFRNYKQYAFHRERAFRWGVFGPQPGSILSTKVCREVGGFDTGYLIAADMKLMLTIGSCSTPVIFPHPLARMEAGGISDRKILDSCRERFLIATEMGAQWEAIPATFATFSCIARAIVGRTVRAVRDRFKFVGVNKRNIT